ncbi:hypothetical protein BJ912DRAFT_1007536 [Pholiota molesta]|nr:hypothetical protein BJ912DRAFT_1007536 [Pholiota molesta]
MTDQGDPVHTEPTWNTVVTDIDADVDESNNDSENDVPTGLGLNINAREVTLQRKSRKVKNEELMPVAGAVATVKSEDEDATELRSSSPSLTGAPSRATRSIRALPEDSQRIVRAACDLLREHITKLDPWPDTTKTNSRGQSSGLDAYTTLSMELWYEACSLLSIEDVDPMGAELKRILERTPQFRGQVRDKASLLVVHAYNFTDIRVLGKKLTKDEITEITSQNRDIYASLKDKFWYKVPNDTTIPDTMYRHPIIQHVLNMAWFGEGTYARSKFFLGDSEIPLVTIALILTAIENALDAWRTGRFHRVEFSCKEYHHRYNKHLRRLKLWKTFCSGEPFDLATDVQTSLLENARLSIGEDNEQPVDGADEETEEDLLATFAANRTRAM